MKKLLMMVAMSLIALPAIAGKYDFSDSNLDHLRGAYQMCEKMGFSGNGPDCPVVYERCWTKYTYHSKGKLRTKCKQSASFSGTAADGEEAISDAGVLLKE